MGNLTYVFSCLKIDRKGCGHNGKCAHRVPGAIGMALAQKLIAAMKMHKIEPRTALSTAMVEGYAAKEEIKEAAKRIAAMAADLGLLLPDAEPGESDARTIEEHNDKWAERAQNDVEDMYSWVRAELPHIAREHHPNPILCQNFCNSVPGEENLQAPCAHEEHTEHSQQTNAIYTSIREILRQSERLLLVAKSRLPAEPPAAAPPAAAPAAAAHDAEPAAEQDAQDGGAPAGDAAPAATRRPPPSEEEIFFDDAHRW